MPERSDGITGRFELWRVVTISVGHLVHDTYTAFLPPLVPLFKETLFLNNTQAGLLRVFLQWPSLFQPFVGHLADRVNLRYVVILAPAVTAAMMSLLGVAPTFASLALLLVVAGLSSACMHAVGPVLAGKLSGPSLGRGMGFWMVGGESGRFLGPVVVVGIVELLGLRGTPWLMVAGLLASSVFFLLLRDVPWRASNDGEEIPWRRAVRAMGPVLLPVVGVVAVRAFMAAALTYYLPTFLKEEGAALWLAAASLSILEGAGVGGALAGGWLSDRLGRRRVLFASMLTAPLLMFALLAVQGWLQFPILVLLGFTALSVTPVIMALVQESFPENRALANGVYMAISFAVNSGAVVAVGALGDWLGLRQAFTISAAVPFLGLPLISLLPKRRPPTFGER